MGSLCEQNRQINELTHVTRKMADLMLRVRRNRKRILKISRKNVKVQCKLQS